MTDCKCAAFSIVDGVLICSSCGKPSASTKWEANVYGSASLTTGGKAVELSEIENKGRIFPPKSKRRQKGIT